MRSMGKALSEEDKSRDTVVGAGSNALSSGPTCRQWIVLAALSDVVMTLLVAASSLIYDLSHGYVNDGMWEAFWAILMLSPVLLIIPVFACSAISTALLCALARDRTLSTWPGLVIGAFWGMLWALVLYVLHTYNLSTGRVEGDSMLLVILLTPAVSAWCWHCWRLARYLQPGCRELASPG